MCIWAYIKHKTGMMLLLYMSILYYMCVRIYYTTVATVITLHSYFQTGNNNNNGLWWNFSIVLLQFCGSPSVRNRSANIVYNYYITIIAIIILHKVLIQKPPIFGSYLDVLMSTELSRLLHTHDHRWCGVKRV